MKKIYLMLLILSILLLLSACYQRQLENPVNGIEDKIGYEKKNDNNVGVKPNFKQHEITIHDVRDNNILVTSHIDGAIGGGGGECKIHTFRYHEYPPYISGYTTKEQRIEFLKYCKTEDNGTSESYNQMQFIWFCEITHEQIDKALEKLKQDAGYDKERIYTVYTEDQMRTLKMGPDDDIDFINYAWKNESAVYVDGHYYTYDWLKAHTAEDYLKENLPVEQLEQIIIYRSEFEDKVELVLETDKYKELLEKADTTKSSENDTTEETINPDIGGDQNACKIHSGYYHTIPGVLMSMIPPEKGEAWRARIGEEQRKDRSFEGGNIIAFLKDNGISRKEVENIYEKDTTGTLSILWPIDIIFSDDKEVIENFYKPENDRGLEDKVNAAFDRYFTKNAALLDQAISCTKHKKSFHAFPIELISSAHLISNKSADSKMDFFVWLEQNIDNDPSVYDYIRYYEISREEFEEAVKAYLEDAKKDEKIADYNIDILFSGDEAAIEEYYSVDSETNKDTYQLSEDLDTSFNDWYG